MVVVVNVYYFVRFCTYGTNEMGQFTDLLCVGLCICCNVRATQCVIIVVFVCACSCKLFDCTVLAVNCTVHTMKLKYLL